MNIAPALRALDRLKKTDRRKVFREARKPMRADIRDHAKQKTGPEGNWAPIASSTKDRRRRAGRKRGRLLGRLPLAIKIATGPTFIRATWMPRWATAHFRGQRVGHGARLPRRNPAWISRELRRKVGDLLMQALKRAWDRK